MKIRLIVKQTIEEYCLKNTQSRKSFSNWLEIIKYADWSFPDDILFTFGTADLLGAGSNRVIFNIGGNKYRMICKYHFGEKQLHLFVCWIGTHAEYDKLCSDNKQYTISIY